MKTWVKIIIIVIAILLYTGGVVGGSYYLFRCIPADPSADPTGPTTTTITDNSPPAKYCGDKIDIEGNFSYNGIFDIIARNKCMIGQRSYIIKYNCPEPKIKKYSIGLQTSVLIGYNKDAQKFDVIAGAEIFFLRNYKYGSIGFGLIYQQGLIINQYYVGAGIIGKFDF